MSYYQDGQVWFVTGDPNPYDSEEDAESADIDFWRYPAEYVAAADSNYEPPDPTRREPPGLIAKKEEST